MLNRKVSSIGVYGCSFAYECHHNSWCSVLRERLSTPLTSYGLPGACLMYAYNQFLEHHQEHDLNIFLITEHTRDHVFFETTDGGAEYKILLEQPAVSDYDRKIAEAHHLKRIYYRPSWDLRLTAVLDSIRHRDSEVCVINAMTKNKVFGPNMFDIQELDHKHFYGENILTRNESITRRPCHMSPKQNKEFTEYLIQHLNGEIDIHDTMGDNVSKHYTLSQTLEEAGLRRMSLRQKLIFDNRINK